jgi:phosphopentomutase
MGTYRLIERALETLETGFVFVNVIEFDQTWEHRNDVAGFHRVSESWMLGAAPGGQVASMIS